MSNTAFHEPYHYGTFDIASTQTETISITFNADVVTPKIVALANGNLKLKEYSEGSGINVSEDRRTINFDVSGSDFSEYTNGVDIVYQMSFFRTGVVEFTMNFKIVKSNL